MTATVQPALDGTVPPEPVDYDTWLAAVWPHYIAAAATGKTFTCYSVADANKLPDPPNRKAHWGRLITLLEDKGYIRKVDWAPSDRPTTRHSGVRTWRGTAAARREAAA
ncbi:hypothetical protein [Streptomyces sp. NPDC007346]|uniref:hypothetical protein n=1 Tax=Streptomyces sp. NPDC007346 TaxID=3154682 RepID=UPI003455948C